jgi:hypothetical protein
MVIDQNPICTCGHNLNHHCFDIGSFDWCEKCSDIEANHNFKIDNLKIFRRML